MIDKRKNEKKADIILFNFIKDNRFFSKKWNVQKQDNKYTQEILDKTSKRGTGGNGFPDLIYVNEDKKLLILIENKDRVKNHSSKNGDDPINFAVDGIKHYLSFFTNKKIDEEKESIKKFLKNWKIIGIAMSGDINDEYNHIVNTFIIDKDIIKDIRKGEILNEEDYLAFFENIDLEEISNNISKSSSEINRLLRNLDSQKRPVLLSALMICLYNKDIKNDFRDDYINWEIANIIRNIPTTIEDILIKEGIDREKIKVLTNELAFIETDKDLNSTNILKDILKELEDNVIPLFDKKSNYDIIGKFYEEFLRYAGVTNVKKGIVLTPSHITTLFTDLIDIKTDDVIFDPACGTGAFLIAGMNKLIDEIEKSNLVDKEKRKKDIKEKQLIGFEKSSTMYSLSVSNMLFRGDGKSQIFNEDFFSDEAGKILDDLSKKPTIGFVNPPYGGKDNKSNPTKKEIQFLETMLDNCSRYGIIIAPLSTYFKDDFDRNRILSKHTLKYVINMPSELFRPNASTHTAIAVFETHKPHNNKIVFYNLEDDGFVLSKNKGRTDVFNKWDDIKKDLLNKIKNPKENEDFVNLVYKKIEENDEWIIQAHSKTDYGNLTKESFEKSIKEYIIFSTKLKLDLIDKDIDEITLLDILNENNIRADEILGGDKKIIMKINTKNWKEFKVGDVFKLSLGKPIHSIEIDGIRDSSIDGIPYITRTAKNNGIEDFVNKSEVNLKKLSKGNCIIIGAEGFKAFYQDRDFITGNKINILRNKKINLFSALFLNAILNLIIKEKFGYGRGVVKFRLNDLFLKLPVNDRNEPDFEFMENYIKSLPYSSSL